ncbi:hypothetical protein TSAR_007944 [Trichomalopsis sarcophagae]|uniref:Uncharacterized protein n=1 Tax=Trichomalopsis sarcophagae TaxID=543379 RepID=A0A232EYF2_9HYME|nr:hypothetical protein TSAR_007944 [Trichomalopsis sarcophagae]
MFWRDFPSRPFASLLLGGDSSREQGFGVPRGVSSALADGGATVDRKELNTSISALETQLADNMEENNTLRDELQQTQQLLKVSSCSPGL